MPPPPAPPPRPPSQRPTTGPAAGPGPARGFAPEPSGRVRKIARIGAPVAVVAALGFFIWRLANDTAGEKREVPQIPVVALTPPPPPPPPPPQPKPEPQKTVETPVPTPSPAPKPEAPKSDAPKQLTINGPAQAGSDAFGVAAGSGGGLSVGGDPNGGNGPGGGGGFDQANYARGLRAALQAAIQSDDEVSRLAFAAQVRIWIDGAGRVSRAVIARSSGDPRTDKAILQALERVSRLDPPPPALRLPVRVELAGRRV